MKLVGLIAALLAACTTFDPVARGVCGNGIVEVGEDCDSTDPKCIACAVQCSTALDCPNSAYTCGTDDRCHAPGGTLGQGQLAGPFAANDYRITDIDQDGIGDVVGTSRSSIVVRHGAASGQLDVLDSSLTPTQTGPASFGYLDGDASLDIAIATPDGLVAYTSPYGTLSPLDVDNLIADPTATSALDIRYLFTVSHEAVGGFVADATAGPTHGKVLYAVFDFINLNNPTFGLPCGQAIDQASFNPASVEVYQVNADGTAPADIVVALVNQKHLCVLAVHKDSSLAISNVTDITPSNAPPYTNKPVLADLSIDADHCPSLIDTDGGVGALRKYDGALVGGHCTLKAAASGGDVLPAMPVTSGSAKIIGRAPMLPTVANEASDLLVLSDGLYLLKSGGWDFQYAAARPWSHVGFADLDKDGSIDLVLSGEGADDLDILYHKLYLGLFPAFQLLRLDTASEVSSIVIDDFDGNGWPDIAFTEKLATHTELDVAYGTSDRPQAPIQVGVFSALIAAAKVGLPDSADPLDAVADLMVLTPGDPIAGLTFLHGSAQRSMLPYFDPRSDNNGTKYRDNTIFRSTAIGLFIPTLGSTTDHPDLLGIAVPKTAATPAGPDARAWIASGNGTTLDGTASDGIRLSGLAACGLGASNTGCVEEALTFPWRVSDTHDVVFAIDHAKSATASVFDPSATAATLIATKATGFGPIPPDSIPQALHAADLDGDGALELIGAFASDTASGGVLVCEVDGTGQPNNCTDVVASAILPVLPPGATASCFDAAPGHFTARDRFSTAAAPADLIVACHDTGSTLYRVTKSGGSYTAEVLLHTASALTSIQVGDVTGDGIDDVVALEGASGTESLVVYAQCSSRNAASCTGESR